MNTKYDKQADALYMRFNKGKVAKTLRLDDRLIVDLDSKSNVLGVEFLNAKLNLLKYMIINEEHENLWKSAAKDKFFKSYSKSDEIYDQI